MTQPVESNLRMCLKCGDYGKWDEFNVYGRIDPWCPSCAPARVDNYYPWSDEDDA